MRFFVYSPLNQTSSTLDLPELLSNKSVAEVKRIIEQHTSIPANQQVLVIPPFEVLLPEIQLSKYINKDRQDVIFVFDKRTFTSDTPPHVDLPPLVKLTDLRTSDPTRFHEGYDKIFQQHLTIAMNYCLQGFKYFELAERLANERRYLPIVVEIIKKSCRVQYDRVQKVFDKIDSKRQELVEKSQNLLPSLEKIIETLSKTAIAPSLSQNPSHKNLLDLVGEDLVRGAAESCKLQTTKVSALLADISTQLNALYNQMISIQVPLLEKSSEEEVTCVNATLQSMREIREMCEIDYQKSVGHYSDPNLLEGMYQQHKTALAKLRTMESLMRDSVTKLLSSTQRSWLQCQSVVSQFTKLERQIVQQSFRQMLKTAYDGIVVLDKNICLLEYAQRLPEVYSEYIAEIARRRAWSNQFLARIAKINSSIKEAVDAEKSRRVEFEAKFALWLPGSFLQLIAEPLPNYSIPTTNIDAKLPSVNGEDPVEVQVNIDVGSSDETVAELRALLAKKEAEIAELKSKLSQTEQELKDCEAAAAHLQSYVMEQSMQIQQLESMNESLTQSLQQRGDSFSTFQTN